MSTTGTGRLPTFFAATWSAAVAVYRDGVKVVDLWGGFRNGITQAPWQEDTLVNMFSTTKGVASLAIAVAVAQGLIDAADEAL
jgi:CubicO group peptidase (beta-lactamase class C family)